VSETADFAQNVLFLKTVHRRENPMCALINTEGTVSVQKDDVNPSFKFEARTCAHSGRSDFVVAGAFDPAKSAEDLVTDDFSFFFYSGSNSLTSLSFTLDVETDLSEESGGYAPKKAEDFPDKQKRVYHMSTSSTPLQSRRDPTDQCGDSILIFNVGEPASNP